MTDNQTSGQTSGDIELLSELATACKKLVGELGKIIIGQESVLEEILITLLSRGHLLLVGVPGLAKTLIIRTLAQLLDLRFNRIQFTPDLMPSDIIGTEILQEKGPSGLRGFVFERGPIFANLLLADEINRTPPKTQSALLEAMQERQVTIGGKRYTIDEPFFVLATQNPIEYEGTFPLPEAQLDRFLLNVKIDYPATESDEVDIIMQTTGEEPAALSPILNANDILRFQRLVRRLPVPRSVAEYAVRFVRRSRPTDANATETVRRYVQWGAGPRAAQALVLAAKARAAINGLPTIAVADIKRLAIPVMRHRIILNYVAQSDGLSPEDVITKMIEKTEP